MTNNSLQKSVLIRLTITSNYCFSAALGYKIKDMSTKEFHTEVKILTPYQNCFQIASYIFWKIVASGSPEDLNLTVSIKESKTAENHWTKNDQNHPNQILNGKVAKTGFFSD